MMKFLFVAALLLAVVSAKLVDTRAKACASDAECDSGLCSNGGFCINCREHTDCVESPITRRTAPFCAQPNCVECVEDAHCETARHHIHKITKCVHYKCVESTEVKANRLSYHNSLEQYILKKKK